MTSNNIPTRGLSYRESSRIKLPDQKHKTHGAAKGSASTSTQ